MKNPEIKYLPQTSINRQAHEMKVTSQKTSTNDRHLKKEKEKQRKPPDLQHQGNAKSKLHGHTLHTCCQKCKLVRPLRKPVGRFLNQQRKD